LPPWSRMRRKASGAAWPILLLLSLVLALATCTCHWFHPPSLKESERRELAAHFRGLIASTGGARVWIKRPASPHHTARAERSLEVLATPGAYRAVLSALQLDCGKHELQLDRHQTAASGLHTIALKVTRRGQPICQIILREVPRLLRAAIVIDDLGQDLEAVHKLLALPYPFTFSVLPHLRDSRATAEEAHRRGREVMLHLPMEAQPGVHPSPGKGDIHMGMSAAEVQGAVQNDLATVPFAAGVNNHMGSRATKSVPLMADVMKVLAEHHLYFIDSRTTAESVALDVARRQGLPAFYRAVFLDDTETVSYTLGQLREFRRVVEEQGAGLAIGHPHATTIAALAKFLPELEQADIDIVKASELVHLPEVARLHPAAKPRS
jgi:uncharacterized protein